LKRSPGNNTNVAKGISLPIFRRRQAGVCTINGTGLSSTLLSSQRTTTHREPATVSSGPFSGVLGKHYPRYFVSPNPGSPAAFTETIRHKPPRNLTQRKARITIPRFPSGRPLPSPSYRSRSLARLHGGSVNITGRSHDRQIGPQRPYYGDTTSKFGPGRGHLRTSPDVGELRAHGLPAPGGVHVRHRHASCHLSRFDGFGLTCSARCHSAQVRRGGFPLIPPQCSERSR
jgi:hypothetical protein